MERTDARTLSPAVLNERRRRAVQLRLAGMKLDEVVALAELAKGTVITAVKAYHAGGWEAVNTGRRGVPKGAGCTLNERQQDTVRHLIHDNTPDQVGLPFALWSRTAVLAVIAQQFGIAMPVRTVGHYLKRWGFTPQKPLNRAYEQNPKAVKAWIEEQYPAIAKRAKAEGAEIHWGDETGLRSDDVRGRSYVPRGETPVVQTAHRRESLGLISAVTNRGTVRKVFLILDNLKVHHSSVVTAWLAAHRDRIEVFYLPSYSPELNLDELLNADLKAVVTKKAHGRHKGALKKATVSELRRLEKSPDLVRKFFQHDPVKYAA